MHGGHPVTGPNVLLSSRWTGTAYKDDTTEVTPKTEKPILFLC